MAEGFGALLYAAVLVRRAARRRRRGGGSTGAALRAGPRRQAPAVARKPDKGQIFALLALLHRRRASSSESVHLGAADTYIWPLLLIGAGVALVWRQADNARRAQWVELEPQQAGAAAGPGGRPGWCWSAWA